MEDNINVIREGDMLLGMVIPKNLRCGESTFFTDGELPLQMGVFAHEDEFNEPLHTHAEVERSVERTHQVVHLTEGSMTVRFHLEDGTHVADCEIEAGDTVLLADGAHAVKADETVRGITVKQGPYLGEERDIQFLEGENR